MSGMSGALSPAPRVPMPPLPALALPAAAACALPPMHAGRGWDLRRSEFPRGHCAVSVAADHVRILSHSLRRALAHRQRRGWGVVGGCPQNGKGRGELTSGVRGDRSAGAAVAGTAVFIKRGWSTVGCLRHDCTCRGSGTGITARLGVRWSSDGAAGTLRNEPTPRRRYHGVCEADQRPRTSAIGVDCDRDTSSHGHRVGPVRTTYKVGTGQEGTPRRTTEQLRVSRGLGHRAPIAEVSTNDGTSTASPRDDRKNWDGLRNNGFQAGGPRSAVRCCCRKWIIYTVLLGEVFCVQVNFPGLEVSTV